MRACKKIRQVGYGRKWLVGLKPLGRRGLDLDDHLALLRRDRGRSSLTFQSQRVWAGGQHGGLDLRSGCLEPDRRCRCNLDRGLDNECGLMRHGLGLCRKRWTWLQHRLCDLHRKLRDNRFQLLRLSLQKLVEESRRLLCCIDLGCLRRCLRWWCIGDGLPGTLHWAI